jgi:hypothetical protein
VGVWAYVSIAAVLAAMITSQNRGPVKHWRYPVWLVATLSANWPLTALLAVGFVVREVCRGANANPR